MLIEHVYGMSDLVCRATSHAKLTRFAETSIPDKYLKQERTRDYRAHRPIVP